VSSWERWTAAAVEQTTQQPNHARVDPPREEPPGEDDPQLA
jgi:hypothetical protein